MSDASFALGVRWIGGGRGMPDQPVYSIGAVARMLGIPAATLRTWEDRYGTVVPARSHGGHRLYSRNHVEQLRFIGNAVAAGLSPGDACRLLQERLDAGVPLHHAEAVDGMGLSILLAEQDPYAADFAEYFLRLEGYDVTLVTNAEDALADVARTSPDVAVIDLLISGGRGLELCALLGHRFDVPILAISALELGDYALEAGAGAFLRKPLHPWQLVSVTKDLLRRNAVIQPG